MGESADLDFFTTTAQIIPVMMLVIVFELRAESAYWSARNGWAFLMSVAAIVPLLIGEFAALEVLIADVSHEVEADSAVDDAGQVVWWSILVSASVVFFYILVSRLSTLPLLAKRSPEIVALVVLVVWINMFAVGRGILGI